MFRVCAFNNGCEIVKSIFAVFGCIFGRVNVSTLSTSSTPLIQFILINPLSKAIDLQLIVFDLRPAKEGVITAVKMMLTVAQNVYQTMKQTVAVHCLWQHLVSCPDVRALQAKERLVP